MNRDEIQAKFKDIRQRFKAAIKAWQDEKDDTLKIGTTIYKHPQYLQDRKDALMRIADEIRVEGEKFIQDTYNELMKEATLSTDTLYEPTVGELEALKDISAQIASASTEELNALFPKAQNSIQQDTKQAWAFRTAILRSKDILTPKPYGTDFENDGRSWALWGGLVKVYEDKHDSSGEIRAYAEELRNQWKYELAAARPFGTLGYMDRLLIKQYDPEGYKAVTAAAK